MEKMAQRYYRTVQSMLNIGTKIMPWRKAIRVEGKGVVRKIPNLLRLRKVTHPMVVSGPNLTKHGIAARVLDVLEKAGIPYSFFNQVEANPGIKTVEAIAAVYAQEGCDGFIAVGGGSPMDAAKAAAALTALPHRPLSSMGGLLKVRKKLPPFIAVPTTAGSGSETSIAAVVTDDETHQKYAIMDPVLVPTYAVLDPELTVGLPPAMTAATGMDAMTHAVESYLCYTMTTPETMELAQEAVEIITRWLPVAYKDGKNIKARQAMQQAAYKAGWAFTRSGVGNVHAIAHTLGGLYGTPHGLACAVVLPVVLEDYGDAVWPKLANLAQAAGVATGQGEEADATAFIGLIKQMNKQMGIPEGFDFIKSEDIPQMVEWALNEANPLYPVPVIYTPERCAAVIERLRLEEKQPTPQEDLQIVGNKGPAKKEIKKAIKKPQKSFEKKAKAEEPPAQLEDETQALPKKTPTKQAAKKPASKSDSAKKTKAAKQGEAKKNPKIEKNTEKSQEFKETKKAEPAKTQRAAKSTSGKKTAPKPAAKKPAGTTKPKAANTTNSPAAAGTKSGSQAGPTRKTPEKTPDDQETMDKNMGKTAEKNLK